MYLPTNMLAHELRVFSERASEVAKERESAAEESCGACGRNCQPHLLEHAVIDGRLLKCCPPCGEGKTIEPAFEAAGGIQ